MADKAIYEFEFKGLAEGLAHLQQIVEKMEARHAFNVGSNGSYNSAYDKFISAGNPGAGKGSRTAFNATSSGRSDWGSGNAAGWGRMQEIAHDSKVNGPQSFISRFRQESHLAALDWARIGKSIGATQKHFASIGRNLVNFRSLGEFALGGGAVAGAFGLARGAANDITSRSLQAKELGLPFGAADAFNDVYGPVTGLDTGNLAAIAAIKSDPTKIGPLAALGIKPQELASKDAVSIALEAAQHAGDMYRKNPQQYGAYASATGADRIVSTNAARVASGMTPDDWAKLAASYTDLAKQLFVSAKAQADAAIATVKFNAALDEAKTNLENAFTPLIGKAGDLAKEWGDDVAAFANSKELKDDIDGVTESFRSLRQAGDWVAKWLNKLIPTTVDPNQKHDVHFAKDSVAANAVRFWDDPSGTWKAWRNGTLGPASAVDYDWTWRTKSGTAPASTFADIEKHYGLQPGTLGTIEQIESDGGKNLVGPMTKYGWRAKGAFQFSPADLQRYHVADAMNVQAEAGAAGQKMADLLKRFRGNQREALAAYNAGEGTVQKLVDQHGDDWASYLPQQTKTYLAKAAGMGYDFGDSPAAQLIASRNDISNTSGSVISAAADRFMEAANIMRDAMREGGGSRFRTPDAPAKPVEIKITNATGSNIHASNSQLPGS